MFQGLPIRRIRSGLSLLLASALLLACSKEAAPVAELRSSLAAVGARVTGGATVRPAEIVSPARPAAARAGPSQPASGFTVQSILAPDRPMQPGDYLWDDQAAPAGPLRIVVDLQAQRLYVYRGGIEIGRSSIAYGADDKPTPLGSFPILEKDADHVSNIYDAEMPYMLRLTWDGIAIHGSTVDDWAATNGCIGVPDEFAALLFRQAKLGDRVLVTKAWLRDVYEA
jgi:lipoprotein-anchoring transpeptidase ErfK/SrfK